MVTHESKAMANKGNPLISIVTPTYNRAGYIEDTILSVLSQSYTHIEYIVIDGGSTDDSLSVLEKYRKQDGRLTYVSEKDEGMYDAINKGYALAKGDMLAYINSDDAYTPEAFMKVIEYFQGHPEIDVVYGDTLVIEGDVRDVHVNLYMPYPENWLKAGGIIAQPTVFMRRQCWDKVGNLGKDVKYLGDCEYWLRLINHGCRFGKINEVLAVELDHAETLRSTMEKEIEDEKRYLRKKYWPEFPANGIIRKIVLFTRRALTPLLHLFLILKINMGLSKGSWGNFVANYKPRANIYFYILNKIFKSNHTVWTVRMPIRR